ncbi:alkene reductase [Mycetocola manganoxydans]|uniref:Alkene reductase n=1 Tax=Mycetocola manganoxydans TaxID=699879 RepID=A0A3L6ZR03_9MICO|nr:alkene reductase [Mycetocola manganoxydans]RLP70258.1 alkene reductase [Mycetocola manganoxydans]GHD49561.1 alkene reductase [Mycetocola manganoxydans]
MDLFSPVSLGDLHLPNRVVMAPLTRSRSGDDGIPGDIVVEHYAQRASLGLIITEGTYVSAESQAFVGQPGIVTPEQIEGWRRVADAVHAKGGRIVMQLMHGGRVSHTAITGTDRIVAPSAIAIEGMAHTPVGKQDYPVPHALTLDELETVRDEFVTAAKNAIEAGLDGVEMHSANGYLLHEFLSPASNVRDDSYGGTPENRARFVAEVTRAVATAVGAGRVGIRISPEHNIQGALETDAADVTDTYTALLDELAPLGLAYLSVLHREPAGELVKTLRAHFGGALVTNSGFGTVTTREEAIDLIDEAHADAVAIGRLALANPDLVERWQGGHEENEPNPRTFYSDGAEGYTDYPRLVL